MDRGSLRRLANEKMGEREVLACADLKERGPISCLVGERQGQINCWTPLAMTLVRGSGKALPSACWECFVPINLEDVTSVLSHLMALRRAVPCVLSSWWPEDRAAVLRSSHPGLGARVPGWESGSVPCQLCFVRQLSPPLWALVFSCAKCGKCFLVH